MSFLAPLYLLASLAIGLPIAFHLIRRTPQGRQIFGSVMFLTPSPPRMTKRSRVEDWLLLLLRGLAICLLAFAFARPFLRSQTSVAQEAAQRRVAILMDVSASMRRPGLYEEALSRLQSVLNDLHPTEAAEVIAYSDSLTPLVSFQEWLALDPSARKELAMDRARSVSPGWGGTALGNAMLQAAGDLQDETDAVASSKSLIVISDFQEGSRIESLLGEIWPEEIAVQVQQIKPAGDPTNVSIQSVSDPENSNGQSLVRVTNAADSRGTQFQLAWGSDAASGQAAGRFSAMDLNLEPGESRVIAMPKQATGASSNRIVITGDHAEFDNACYVAPWRPQQVEIAYLGMPDEENSPQGLRFFLEPVFASTPLRIVQISDWPTSANRPNVLPDELSLLIIGGELSTEQAEWTRNWVSQGGQVLFVCRSADQAQSLASILKSGPIPIQEADVGGGYAMIGDVALNHPVMALFDDPRFSDFSKLKFWRHRTVELPDLPGITALARFDDGSPALAEIPLGKGRVFLLASGWGREDSDLALWSKFVPLMNRLLEYAAGEELDRRQNVVGDRLALSTLGLDATEIWISGPDGESQHSPGDSFIFQSPGIYRFAASRKGLVGGEAVVAAVNLTIEESRTAPLGIDVLEAAGVPFEEGTKSAEAAAIQRSRERQLMNQELESRQQAWRWLIVAALAVLLLETAWAGWRSRTRSPVTQPL